MSYRNVFYIFRIFSFFFNDTATTEIYTLSLHDALPISAGTHPFSLFERQRITARDRYRHLVDQLQYVARRELIFGLHIHVAVDDPERAVQVVNGLLAHLAQFLALSASSPFWRGEPTGLASSRQMVFAAFPRSGPPPRFRDYADYA